MLDQLLQLLPQRTGHFQFESTAHGDVWLDLDHLFLRPAALHPFVEALAQRLAAHEIDGICGPASGGAFLAQLLAQSLNKEFFYTQRLGDKRQYILPPTLWQAIRGKRLALVDDAINAAWAIRSTCHVVQQAGGIPAAFAALLVCPNTAASLWHEHHLPLHTIGRLPGNTWPAGYCPLCAKGVPFDQVQ